MKINAKIIYAPLFPTAIEVGLDASRGLAGFEVGSCLTLKWKKKSLEIDVIIVSLINYYSLLN